MRMNEELLEQPCKRRAAREAAARTEAELGLAACNHLNELFRASEDDMVASAQRRADARDAALLRYTRGTLPANQAARVADAREAIDIRDNTFRPENVTGIEVWNTPYDYSSVIWNNPAPVPLQFHHPPPTEAFESLCSRLRSLTEEARYHAGSDFPIRLYLGRQEKQTFLQSPSFLAANGINCVDLVPSFEGNPIHWVDTETHLGVGLGIIPF